MVCASRTGWEGSRMVSMEGTRASRSHATVVVLILVLSVWSDCASRFFCRGRVMLSILFLAGLLMLRPHVTAAFTATTIVCDCKSSRFLR